MHFASEPARANLRVSAFLHAARALLFFAAGATPDKSCFFLRGASTSATSLLTAADEEPDAFDDEEEDAAAAGEAAAARDGRVSGPVNYIKLNSLVIDRCLTSKLKYSHL